MADSTSGNSEELKLRITPELDQAALDKVKKQMEDIPSEIPIGPKKSGKTGGDNDTKREVSNLRELLAVQNQIIRNEDLRLRKTRSRAEAEIRRIRETASAEKMSLSEMNNLISVQENKIENANIAAQKSYNEVGKELDRLRVRYDGIVQAEKQVTDSRFRLFYANQRLTENMNSMSGSMARIESQTKMSSLAFMNFGRIVQDAPFGLIGIANNIDPLIVSFQMLAQEVDSTTGKVRGAMGAFKAMGAQLFGPAGLIFLLGSALPSALILLQKRQQEASKESDKLAEAFKRVAEEYAKLAAEAAGERGLETVNKELSLVEKQIKAVEEQTNKFNAGLQKAAQNQAKSLATGGDVASIQQGILTKLKEQNKAELDKLQSATDFLKVSKENLDLEKKSIESKLFIKGLVKDTGIAASLTAEQEQENQQKINDLVAEEIGLRNKMLGEIAEAKNALSKRIQELEKDRNKATNDALRTQINSNIEALRAKLLVVEDEIRAEYAAKIKGEKKTQQDILKLRQEFLDKYNDYVLSDLAKRMNAEKAELKEILDSEFATNEQKLNATRVYERNIFDIKQEFLRKVFDESIKMSEKEAAERQSILKRIQDPLTSQSNLNERRARLLTWAEATGQELLAIDIRRDQELANLRKQFNTQALQNIVQFKQAEFAIEERAEMTKHQLKLDRFTEVFQAAGELASQAATLILGESKEAAITQVVIDTAMGIQKIWAQSGMNPVVGGLLTAALAAKGVVAIRKIQQADAGSNAADSGSTTTTKQIQLESPGLRSGRILTPLADDISASASPFMGDRNRDVRISANVDRRGLAIAVREGEREIRTQQFDYR